MRAEQYQAIFDWFQARPRIRQLLRLTMKGAVAAVYALYFAVLAWLAWQRSTQFWPVLTVPAAVFLSGTALRSAIDRPRPYEALHFVPLFPKDTKGQSMPSRHCFSAAAIAVAAWSVSPVCGIAAAVLAAGIAVSRVLAGVHYPSDVIAGLGYGVALGLLGNALWTLWL